MAGNSRVLIVDQDPETRAELQKGLARSQFVVVGGVGYGAEALSLASELRPHAVLVGVEKPPARALQTVESLAELLPDSPVLVYSSMADAESARKAVVAGARDYLMKPLRMQEVVKAVNAALAQQERRKAAQSGEPGLGLRSAGLVVTIFGAKGGIGKTTTATNLATAFALLNSGSAVLVDVDTTFGDAALMLDLPVEVTLAEAVARSKELDRDTLGSLLTPHPSGLKVLPAPFEPVDWRKVDPDGLEKVLTLLAQTHDFVVLDCPTGFTDLVAVALEKANVVLLLTSMDITSVKGTTTALKLLANGVSSDDKIKLVVNHSTNANSLNEQDVSKVLRREVFWSIPHDEEIAASAQIGAPVVIDRPESLVSQSISELAATLAGVEPTYSENGHSTVSASTGLLTRLFKR